MRADPLAPLISHARKRLGLSQQQLAAKVGVSVNTLGELERGKRPRVALETVYRIMEITGISALFHTPDGLSAEIRPGPATSAERAARAAARRATWHGGVVPSHVSEPPTAHGSAASRLRALSEITGSAYALAAAGDTARSRRGIKTARADGTPRRPRSTPRGAPVERRAGGR